MLVLVKRIILIRNADSKEDRDFVDYSENINFSGGNGNNL
jgi:hypothetical protein